MIIFFFLARNYLVGSEQLYVHWKRPSQSFKSHVRGLAASTTEWHANYLQIASVALVLKKTDSDGNRVCCYRVTGCPFGSLQYLHDNLPTECFVHFEADRCTLGVIDLSNSSTGSSSSSAPSSPAGYNISLSFSFLLHIILKINKYINKYNYFVFKYSLKIPTQLSDAAPSHGVRMKRWVLQIARYHLVT